MAKIKIKLLESYSNAEFDFGCSKTDDVTTVSNWQTANNELTVNDGVWFCFAKKINSQKVFRFKKIVKCSNVCTFEYISFMKKNHCQIVTIPPYIKGTTPPPVACQIVTIPPYIKGTTPPPVACQIVTIPPYIKVVTPIVIPVQFQGINSINI
jgi:hypothetical protein